MAIYVEGHGNISYECSDLIADVHEDIETFGRNAFVYAVYRYLPKYNINIIVDYTVCEQLDDEPEERELIRKFKATLRPDEKMITLTLDELLTALVMQNSII